MKNSIADKDIEVIYDDVIRIKADKKTTKTQKLGIEDIAKLAGVSSITISRALKQPEIVKDKTRKKILAIIEQTGFKLNPHASALKSGRTNIVMAIVSNLLSQQYATMVQQCSQVIEDAGFQFLIAQTSHSYQKETQIIQTLSVIKPAAVIFTSVVELEENREILKALNIPIMETWAYPQDPIDLLVGFSNTKAGYLAAIHLAEKDYKKVAYFGRATGRGRLRFQGFQKGCQELGLELLHDIRQDKITDLNDGKRMLKELLKKKKKVQAVFCANDLLTAGVLMEAQNIKLTIPDDLAVIGFSESNLLSMCTPSPTTIHFDYALLGKTAGEMIVKKLLGENVNPKVHIELSTHPRLST